jgi:sirohydrochlorin ferrochelatase
MKTALLLIAHGSREPEANDDLYHLVSELRRRTLFDIVEPAFLEFAEPNGDAGAKMCVQQGAERVIILPYFLSAGVHVRRDLSTLRDRLAGKFSAVEFRLAEPLGRHPMLVEIVLERARRSPD